jgi:hypothetical protein
MRRPVLGDLFRLGKSISVERAQDQAKVGKGNVMFKDDIRIIGDGTEFTKAFNVGDSISFISKKGQEEIEDQIIALIIDDKNIQLKKPGVLDSDTT